MAEKFWANFNFTGWSVALSYFYNNFLVRPRDNRPLLAFYKEFKSAVKLYFLSRLLTYSFYNLVEAKNLLNLWVDCIVDIEFESNWVLF